MHNDFPQFGTYLFAALIIFVVYWRLRRTFGRQPLRRPQMILRMVLFAVLAALLSPAALRSPGFAAAAAGGLAAGIVLALWGAARTQFEWVGARLYYIPHTYTGIAVSLLFLGRIAFRMMETYGTPHAEGANSPPGPPPGLSTYVSSPFTLGLFFVLVGYYVCYYGLVLWKAKHLMAEQVTEVTPPPGAVGVPAVTAPTPETPI